MYSCVTTKLFLFQNSSTRPVNCLTIKLLLLRMNVLLCNHRIILFSKLSIFVQLLVWLSISCSLEWMYSCVTTKLSLFQNSSSGPGNWSLEWCTYVWPQIYSFSKTLHFVQWIVWLSNSCSSEWMYSILLLVLWFLWNLFNWYIQHDHLEDSFGQINVFI